VQQKAQNDAMGEIIARIDGLLYESVYGDHPELRELGKRRSEP
jgi:hypothetical protein